MIEYFIIVTSTTRLENKLIIYKIKTWNMILCCPRAIHNKSYFNEFVTTLIILMYNKQKSTIVVNAKAF